MNSESSEWRDSAGQPSDLTEESWSCSQESLPFFMTTLFAHRLTTRTFSTVLHSFTALSTISLRGTIAQFLKPPSEVMTIFASESCTLSRTASELKPAKITEWTDPIRAQASLLLGRLGR